MDAACPVGRQCDDSISSQKILMEVECDGKLVARERIVRHGWGRQDGGDKAYAKYL
jgi:hypothetical protein